MNPYDNHNYSNDENHENWNEWEKKDSAKNDQLISQGGIRNFFFFTVLFFSM